MKQLEFIALQPTISKEYLFSRGLNQESIMQHYTGIDVHSKKLFRSILRTDHKVTCSFYKSKSGILYMHDFATNEYVNCFDVVMRLYNVNYYEALKIIATDFNLLEGKKHTTNPIIVSEIKKSESARIQCQIKEFTQSELDWWASYGIDFKILKKFHIFSIAHVFVNGHLSFSSDEKNPIYGYYFGKDKNGIELWKCYMPNRKETRFIGNLNQKVLQGYKQLPKTGELLVINKSMKDSAALYRLGIPSISPNSETCFPSEKQIEEFKSRFKHVLVVFDNDKPGLHNLWLIRKKYPELNYFWIPKKLGAKDFTDLIKLIGLDKVKELVNKFMSNYKFK